MKHLFHVLPKLAAVAAVVLSVSSCNRAEYAMLPKTTPYHATYGSVVKAAPTSVAAGQEAPSELNAAPEAVTAAPAPVAPQPANPKPATKARLVAAAQPTKSEVSAAPRKLSLGQKLATAKVLKQLDKVTSKVQLKPRREAAGANRLEGKLRQGVILLIVGLLLELLGVATGLDLIYILGAIVAIIGVILIVLYLLDEL